MTFQELNEGVQWRINIPNFELGSDAPLCPDLLFVQFGLVYQEYEETPAGEDGKTSFQIIGPREIVSLQLIGLQSVGSGFHQFFPVKFSIFGFVLILYFKLIPFFTN